MQLIKLKNQVLNGVNLIDENGRKIMVCGLHNTEQGKYIENFSHGTCNLLASCIIYVDWLLSIEISYLLAYLLLTL